MDRDTVVGEVQTNAEWWLSTRLNKIREEQHGSMEVNPFMAPLIFALHGHSNFVELADFLLGGHFAIGHATGFGKLIDEKILPRVFGTTKLDKAMRRGTIYAESCFDNIDHVVCQDGQDALLSLKASKWTIQLGQAVELNNSFKTIRDMRDAGRHNHGQIIVGVFYGTAENLTDKYRLVRGISLGANHDVRDIQDYVAVLAGQEFWAWLGGHADTQLWVMQGIHAAIESRREELSEAQALLSEFRASFVRRYEAHVNNDGTVDWTGILRSINGV